MIDQDLFYLCALKTRPEQRIVHQHAHAPCVPDSVYFRLGGSGALRVNKLAFRRLQRGGWLRRIVADKSEFPQDEWGLSEAAEERFRGDHFWQQALFLYKQALSGSISPAA